MSVEEQARLLAEWLESHPGTDPPAEIDPEVVEAVYALRPDLAPAPRVSLDDILGSLTAGPLADPAKVVAAPPDAEPAPAEVIPFPRRWGRVVSGVGAVAALAAALLLYVRVDSAPEPASVAMRELGPSAEPSWDGIEGEEVAELDLEDFDPADELRPDEPEQERLREEFAQPSRPTVAAKPSPLPRPRPAPAQQRAPEAVASAPPPPPPPIESAPDPEPWVEAEPMEDAVADVDDLGTGAGGLQGMIGGQLGGIVESKDRNDLDELDAYEGADEDEATAGKLKASDAVADTTRETSSIQAVPARDEQAYVVDGEASGRSASFSYEQDLSGEAEVAATESRRGNSGPFGRKKERQASAAEVPAGAAEVLVPPITDLRSRAVPTDLSESDLLALDGPAPATNATARGFASTGEFRNAADVVAGDTGVTNAAQAAHYYLAAGDPGSAIVVADRGLAMSAANTPQRSWLLVLKGDAQRAIGALDSASEAYEQAIELNSER